jgi:hypothetical protein
VNQPTSIQMLDAAIRQELGGEKTHDAVAVYHTLSFFPGGCLPLGIPRNGGDQTFCKGYRRLTRTRSARPFDIKRQKMRRPVPAVPTLATLLFGAGCSKPSEN